MSDGTRSLTWDAANHVRSVSIGGHSSVFLYDGLGRRVEIIESENGATTSDTHFVWCGLQICESRDATGEVIRRYFELGIEESGSPYFYARDHLGSVQELMDEVGGLAARYTYDPWGQRTDVSGDKDVDFGFSGHFEHEKSGLTLTAFRAYDGVSGRWTSEDPIGIAGGLNLFAYVGNNPVSRVDLYGLCPGDGSPDKRASSGDDRGNQTHNDQSQCADAMCQIAAQIDQRAGMMTRPSVYGQLVLSSALGGLAVGIAPGVMGIAEDAAGVLPVAEQAARDAAIYLEIKIPGLIANLAELAQTIPGPDYTPISTTLGLVGNLLNLHQYGGSGR